MACEEILPVSYTFITHGILARLIILDIIKQQKRMPVRNNFFDLIDIQILHFHCPSYDSKLYSGQIRNNGCPYSTGCPFSARISATIPSYSLSISFISFMASTIASV